MTYVLECGCHIRLSQVAESMKAHVGDQWQCSDHGVQFIVHTEGHGA